jgi:hypothetical protein
MSRQYSLHLATRCNVLVSNRTLPWWEFTTTNIAQAHDQESDVFQFKVCSELLSNINESVHNKIISLLLPSASVVSPLLFVRAMGEIFYRLL